MRVSVSYSGLGDLASFMRVASESATAGLDGAWCCEHVGFHDAIVPAAALLTRFPELDVGIVGLAPVSRHPAALAMGLASLAGLGAGRVRAQLGLGDARLISRIGGATNSLSTVRDYVEATHAALSGTEATNRWAGYQLDGFQLFTRPPNPPALDIMALRPRMLDLAAEIADGVALSAGASTTYLRQTVTALEHSLRRHGRRRDSFRITAQAMGCVANTTQDAAARVAPIFAGFSLDALALLAPGLDARHHAPQMGVICDPDSLAERLDAYRQTGIDELAIDFIQQPDEIRAAVQAVAGARPPQNLLVRTPE